MEWVSFIKFAGAFLKGAGWVMLPLLLLPFIRLLTGPTSFFGKLSDHIIQIIDAISNAIGEVAKWALPILVLTMAFGVFADSIFGLSWTKLGESAIYLHVATIMLGAAAALLAGQHVRVDIFHARMKPSQKARIDLIGYYVLLMPACLLILWASQSATGQAWTGLEGSQEADGIKGVFLLKTAIPIFCVMMLMQGLAICLRACAVMRGESEPERPNLIGPLFPESEG